jgi:mono/diheme cytochrome c family protein
MRRLALLLPLALLAAGCIDGTKTSATPSNKVVVKPAVTLTGDPAAGKRLFTAQSCSGCHTFTPAGSKASVGPDLDHLAADAQKASQGSLTAYATTSIKDPSAYVVPGFADGTMPKTYASSLSAQQIADLVAFLTQTKS